MPLIHGMDPFDYWVVNCFSCDIVVVSRKRDATSEKRNRICIMNHTVVHSRDHNGEDVAHKITSLRNQTQISQMVIGQYISNQASTSASKSCYRNF